MPESADPLLASRRLCTRRVGHFLGAVITLLSTQPLSGPLATASQGEDIKMIRNRIRQAMGYNALTEHQGAIEIIGKTEQFGTTGEFRLVFTPDGRFFQENQAPLGETLGFDGTTGWAIDWSGMPRILELRELDVALMLAWIESGRWLADSSPLQILLSPDQTTTEVEQLVLQRAQSRGRMNLDVSRDTWLPIRLERQGIVGVEKWFFSDYRQIEGIQLPHHVRYQVSELTALTTEVSSVRFLNEVRDDLFQVRSDRPVDYHFDHGLSPVLKTMRAATGHVLVQARINDQDPGWFIFDTGAGVSAVTPETAKKLELERVATTVGVSILGVAPSAVYRGDSLSVGALRLGEPLLLEMDLSAFGPVFGVEVAGIVGFDVLSRSVVEIETGDQRIALHDPQQYILREGKWQDVVIHNRHPHVPARFEGEQEGIFRLDVGAAGGPFGNVTFHTQTVGRLNLMRGRDTRPLAVQQMQLATGEIDWFELSGRRFERPQVVFSLDNNSPFADPYTDGNIGVNFMAPFRIVLDYSHKRISFLDLGSR